MSEGQSEVFAFLSDPATYGLREPVRRIDTHGAAVFLAGTDVYKAKRAVKFGFMDLSTLEKRRQSCEAEVTVNRKYAPHLYLGTVPITREGGRLRLGGEGPIVEWTVHLRRFDETQTLDQVADRGGLTPTLIARLARVVLATYAEAEVRPGEAATDALEGVVEETLTALADATEVFAAGSVSNLAETMRAEFARLHPLLPTRGKAGYVRRCHGDLHLRNIVLIDGEPTLFDAIEFDESIATIDILYDLAFLLMDLWERGFQSEANLLLNRILWGSADIDRELEGLAALPLFLSLRAAVRAKVEALRFIGVARAEEIRREAIRYVEAARAFLAPSACLLVGIGGLSGTGKSTLASRIAPAIGRAPGAIHLRSDIERKRILGVGELDRLPDTAYGSNVTEYVFQSLRDQAGVALRAGQSVVVDAVHRQRSERDLLAAVARENGAEFAGLWLDAPAGAMIERVTARTGDASDANAEIVAGQLAEPLGPIEWTRLDSARPIEDVVAAAVSLIQREAAKR